jgi:hypothetical protein
MGLSAIAPIPAHLAIDGHSNIDRRHPHLSSPWCRGRGELATGRVPCVVGQPRRGVQRAGGACGGMAGVARWRHGGAGSGRAGTCGGMACTVN